MLSDRKKRYRKLHSLHCGLQFDVGNRNAFHRSEPCLSDDKFERIQTVISDSKVKKTAARSNSDTSQNVLS